MTPKEEAETFQKQSGRTAGSLADHLQVRLLRAGLHVELALAVVGVSVAAAHGLPGLHALGRTHTPFALEVADRPEGAVGARFIWTGRKWTESQHVLDKTFLHYGRKSVYVKDVSFNTKERFGFSSYGC